MSRVVSLLRVAARSKKRTLLGTTYGGLSEKAKRLENPKHASLFTEVLLTEVR
jgi:hypothetical protein